MRNYKTKILTGALLTVVLLLVYWWGGDAPGLRGWNPHMTEDVGILEAQTATPSATEPEEQPETPPPAEEGEAATGENRPQNGDNTPMTTEEEAALADRVAEDKAADATDGDSADFPETGTETDSATGQDSYRTDPVPEGKPVPIEPQDAVISDEELTCTLSVRCDTILKNMAWLDPEKVELVPRDGVIFPEQTVTFYEGESVFNLLVREMKRNNIHMEFEQTPIFNSAYIEGIANLYEFDCGELSGWIYQVNDWFPNYGCSRYQLQEGDKVAWVYTCDLGMDVGGHESTGNGMWQ